MTDNTLYKTALSKAMSLCAASEHCTGDIAAKLRVWGLDNDKSAELIGVLVKENFINDERYAMSFVKDKFKYNKWGKIKISAHLRAKNIPKACIDTALRSIDNEEYINTLKELIATHSRSVKSKNKFDFKAKLLRFGLSRGFESSLLYDLLNAYDDQDQRFQ